MRVFITGANGFIGQNLISHLLTRDDVEVVTYSRSDYNNKLPFLLDNVDYVFHLAGVNRSLDNFDFERINLGFTLRICESLLDVYRSTGKKIPIIFTSSIHAETSTLYGKSKLHAENALLALAEQYSFPVTIYRLPNVFGKWCRPNYNSAIATFCYNISRDLPVSLDNPSANLRLVYIDDLVSNFLSALDREQLVNDFSRFAVVTPEYTSTVSDLVDLIYSFKDSRSSLVIPAVGIGLTRALYSTYISYLPSTSFSYEVAKYTDTRGTFVEMLRTLDSGQFSYFTAHPGVTRGGHYHHSKTEKFMVICGSARFQFRHIGTGENFLIYTDSKNSRIVESVPGWAHDITNIGTDQLVVLLWSNESFNPLQPDTFVFQL